MSEEQKSLQEQIAVEHYKFLLIKIQHLDEALYKNISFSSKFIMGVFSFIITVIMAVKAKTIPLETLPIAIKSASYLTIFICITFILITFSIILSWRDYRQEEVALLNKLTIDIGRKLPTYKNLYRWTETWFLLALIFIGIAAYNLNYILTDVLKLIH